MSALTNDSMRASSSQNGVIKVTGQNQQSPQQHTSTYCPREGYTRSTCKSYSAPYSAADLRLVNAPPSVCNSEDQPKLFTEAGQTETVRIPRWKRFLDLTCIWLTFPLWVTVMAFVSAWILLVSPGPLLFRQERVGYRRRRFMILKFRTMRINVETQTHEGYFERLMQDDCPMTKLDCHDVRLIRGARTLRALGLDELPQLFNVIRGEMSLVGPRPCTPHEFEHYQPAQKERVNAPPGLTGYWQVNGKNKTTFSEMITMDLLYAEKMSVWIDITIMLRTAPAIAVQFFESLTRKTGAKISLFLKEWRFGGRRVR
jgi:lipopolysaccharide/colanic/teichoic acid biosynthesis glycosyltransferase